jgi:hypothetical protein
MTDDLPIGRGARCGRPAAGFRSEFIGSDDPGTPPTSTATH